MEPELQDTPGALTPSRGDLVINKFIAGCSGLNQHHGLINLGPVVENRSRPNRFFEEIKPENQW